MTSVATWCDGGEKDVHDGEGLQALAVYCSTLIRDWEKAWL